MYTVSAFLCNEYLFQNGTRVRSMYFWLLLQQVAVMSHIICAAHKLSRIYELYRGKLKNKNEIYALNSIFLSNFS